MPVPEPPAGGAVGLLWNPAAGGLRKRTAALRRHAAGLPECLCREVTGPAEIAAALAEMNAAGVATIVIAGGDGTVQAALSHLLDGEGTPLPRLMLLPGGTTNMTARDLGVRGGAVRALRRTAMGLSGRRALACVRRPVLRIEHAGWRVHGLFLGAGLIADGVAFFQRRVRGRGLIGEKAATFAVLRTLLGSGRYRQASAVRVRGDGATAIAGPHGLVLVTALERLLFGARPYWGREPLPLHCTVGPAQPGRILRAAPRLILGRPGGSASPARGFASQNVGGLRLELDGEFAVDGELFTASSAHGPVCVDAAPPVEFLVPS